MKTEKREVEKRVVVFGTSLLALFVAALLTSAPACAKAIADGVVNDDKTIDRTVVLRAVKDKSDDGEEKSVNLPPASKKALAAKVGKTYGVSMDEKERQDFDFDLPKGQFMVYVDAQRIGDGSLTSSIDSSLKLLKRNGAAMPAYSGDLIYWNAHEKEYRAGKAFSFSKPTGVRFRLNNASDGTNNFWLTVVPVVPFKFLPYGFGAKVMDAKIGSNNGVGGTLESREFSYIRAKIPAGKWSVSLGAQETEGRVGIGLKGVFE